MIIVAAQQLQLLHHALGLRVDRRIPFRNHFVASDGHHDIADLRALESAGMMTCSAAPAFCGAGDIVFYATPAGEEYAIKHLPPAPKKTRYDEYLDADYGHSFTEWLCIELPRLETNSYDFRVPTGYVRYVRREFTRGHRWSPEIVGDWKPTKKEAKASYKEKLKAWKERERAYTKGAEE